MEGGNLREGIEVMKWMMLLLTKGSLADVPPPPFCHSNFFHSSYVKIKSQYIKMAVCFWAN